MFSVVVFVFLYTTVANIIERPDGLRIATLFIIAILVVSFISRFRRSPELRATTVSFDGSCPHAVERSSRCRIGDYSDFAQDVLVPGTTRHGYTVLEATAASVPTAPAAIRLGIRDEYGIMPHLYFRWTEGSPVRHLLSFLLLGQGEIAPLTREVLREAEPNLQRRPWVHVG